MRLYGYTSTSRHREQAQLFAYKNEELGIKKVLYTIKWSDKKNYYVLTMSAFAYEEEVLIIDGKKFRVISVNLSLDQFGDDLVIIELHNCY